MHCKISRSHKTASQNHSGLGSFRVDEDTDRDTTTVHSQVAECALFYLQLDVSFTRGATDDQVALSGRKPHPLCELGAPRRISILAS